MFPTRRIVFLLTSLIANAATAQECPQEGPGAPLTLHEEWIMKGWERHEGDPAFAFARKMGKYYDLEDPAGVFWDNFAPGDTKLFTDASKYGPNWESIQNSARSILHGMTSGHSELVGAEVASTSVGFVGRADLLSGEVLAFDARSQLGWKCVSGAWKIKQEINYAWLVEPETIEATLGQGLGR